ncbi:cytochrome C biogenesis factor-like protein [Actinobacillus equuli]|nr:cytochrome C biogenesis factor-like protein [Actinobacillus equuli]
MQAKQSHIGKIWFAVLLIAVGIIGTSAYVSVGSWQAGTMIDMTHKKLEYFMNVSKRKIPIRYLSKS